jgi:hypothetical protein
MAAPITGVIGSPLYNKLMDDVLYEGLHRPA